MHTEFAEGVRASVLRILRGDKPPTSEGQHGVVRVDATLDPRVEEAKREFLAGLVQVKPAWSPPRYVIETLDGRYPALSLLQSNPDPYLAGVTTFEAGP